MLKWVKVVEKKLGNRELEKKLTRVIMVGILQSETIGQTLTHRGRNVDKLKRDI